MKLTIGVLLISSLTTAVYGSHFTEQTPLSQPSSPYAQPLTIPQREQLIRETERLSANNPQFATNMTLLTKDVKDAYNVHCCSSMYWEQVFYKCGCRCEHPCAYVTATGGATTLTTVGLFFAALFGGLPIESGLPIAICLGTPSILLTGCAACETSKRCKSGHTSQLAFIADPAMWPKKPADDQTSYSLDYDSGYDS